MDRQIAFSAVAVVLMLTGALLLVAGETGVIPFATIAVGIALVTVIASGRRHRGPGAGEP